MKPVLVASMSCGAGHPEGMFSTITPPALQLLTPTVKVRPKATDWPTWTGLGPMMALPSPTGGVAVAVGLAVGLLVAVGLAVKVGVAVFVGVGLDVKVRVTVLD